MLFLPLRVWNGVNDSGTEGGGACSIPHVYLPRGPRIQMRIYDSGTG